MRSFLYRRGCRVRFLTLFSGGEGAHFVGAVGTACPQQVEEHGWVQAPSGLPAQARCPRCPSPSAAERPTSSPGFPRQPGHLTQLELEGPVMLLGRRGDWLRVVLGEAGAGTCAGGCCMGCERPRADGFVRACYYVLPKTCLHLWGGASRPLRVLGLLLCGWTPRGGATRRLCPWWRGGSGSSGGCDRGPHSRCLPSVHTSCQPAGSGSGSILAGLPVARDAHLKRSCPLRGRALQLKAGAGKSVPRPAAAEVGSGALARSRPELGQGSDWVGSRAALCARGCPGRAF